MKKHLAAAAIIGLPMSLTLVPANAVEVPDAVSNVAVTGDMQVGQTLTVSANWAVPDHSQPGDTFSLPLPPEFTALQTDFPLKDATGATVATAHVEGGNVIVTLGDYVAEHPLNISGTIRFNATLNESAVPGEPITLHWGDTVTITPTPGWDGVPNTSEVIKYGWGDAERGNGWTIEVPGGENGLTNVTVKDTPADHRIKCDSVRVEVARLDGASFMDWRPLSASVDCTGDAVSIGIPEVPAGLQAFILMQADQGAPLDTDGDGTLTNSFTASGEGVTGEGTANTVVFGAGGTGGGENEPDPEPEPTPEPTPEPEPTVDPTPEPTEDPTPEPTTDPEPSPEPTEQPTPVPTEAPTDEPTEQPTEEPMPEPTETPTGQPTEDPATTPTPTEDPTPAEPTTTEAPEQPAEHTDDPAAAPAPPADTPTSNPVPVEKIEIGHSVVFPHTDEPFVISDIETHDDMVTLTAENGQTAKVPTGQQIEQIPTGGGDLGVDQGEDTTLAHTGIPALTLAGLAILVSLLGGILIAGTRKRMKRR